MNLGLKNSEGYYDLTAYEAIRNICEEEEKNKRQNLSVKFTKKEQSLKSVRRQECEF